MTTGQRRNPWAGFLLLGPALLVIVAVAIYPLASSFALSFQRWRVNRSPSPTGFVGFDQYVRAFTDSIFLNSVVVTLEYTILSVAMTIVLGLAVALILQKPTRMNLLVRTVLIFPYAVSPVLKGFSFRFMLNENYGVIQLLLTSLIPPLKGTVWLADPFWALFWIAVSEVWGWVPLYALMFIGALGTIPNDMFEAAKVDGANNFQVFWHILIPMLMPVLVIATLLKTIFSLKIFDQVMVMTGGGPGRATQSINHFIYQVAFQNLDLGYAAAVAWIFVAALGVVAYFYVRSLYRQPGA
ncbi:MAG TPA: sugar ABC transporter permease [Anaerolineae bacterium]